MQMKEAGAAAAAAAVAHPGVEAHMRPAAGVAVAAASASARPLPGLAAAVEERRAVERRGRELGQTALAAEMQVRASSCS
jgi:hypothetical protein